MKLATQFGIGAASVAVASALAFLPIIAAADEGRGTRDIRDTRPLAQRVEIAITDSGNVLVRGAKVTGITGSTLTVTTTAGSSTLSWAVTTNSSTVFVTSTGSGSSLGAISVGDTVSFVGVLSGNGLSVNATAVKDWTLGVRERSITGPVQNINSTSTSLILGNGTGKDNDNDKDNKTRATVQFTGSTVIMLNGATTTFASIQIGDKIKATGTMNESGTVLTATSVSVTRPTVRLDTDEFRKKVREWFSGHGFSVFGKSGKGN
ncbi:hypothetical protein HY971_03065 [Candidatus Kaiserbacteria bacterium]|nr:hypothetical protein [Candidatus Kaiserbacteria bacterium]